MREAVTDIATLLLIDILLELWNKSVSPYGKSGKGIPLPENSNTKLSQTILPSNTDRSNSVDSLITDLNNLRTDSSQEAENVMLTKIEYFLADTPDNKKETVINKLREAGFEDLIDILDAEAISKRESTVDNSLYSDSSDENRADDNLSDGGWDTDSASSEEDDKNTQSTPHSQKFFSTKPEATQGALLPHETTSNPDTAPQLTG